MENLQETLNAVPHEPGVYLYRNRHGDVIYVGKSRDLARRVVQYFRQAHDAGGKTARLVSEIEGIEVICTTSEFDALLLEARLIRTYLPKYNVVSRDDKSPLYVVITLSEPLPRLLLVRKGEIPVYEKNKKNGIYGPFQSGHALRSLFRQLRVIVPYCTQKERRGKPCFYTHLGLCDPCPGAIVGMTGLEKRRAARQYRKHLFRLRALFEGKTRWLVRIYEKEMRNLAKNLQFERAATIRERLRHLTRLSAYRYDPQVFLDYGANDMYEEELADLLSHIAPYYPTLRSLTRIECVDISHLSGEDAAGSMVVFDHGRPDKSRYRRFRIRSVRNISDVGMMREVLQRRFRHRDWPMPDLLLVDGGKPQVALAQKVAEENAPGLPVAGLAKREEELIIPKKVGYRTVRLPLSGRGIKVLQRIRDEAHRFAIRYHRLLRNKSFAAESERGVRLT